MRDADETTGSLCRYVDLEERVPARHPLRTIRRVVSGALARLDSEFDRLHADFGRPSIAPERLTRAGLLQILFSVRVAPEACLRHDAAPDGAAGLQPAVPLVCGAWHRRQVWVPTLFSKNRDRLLTTDMSRKVTAAILPHREVTVLLSDDHVLVDGTLVKAWASMNSIRPKEDGDPGDPGDPPAQDAAQQDPSPQPDPEPRPMSRPASRSRNAEVDFRGQKRTNATHASTTDADARLYRKSPGTGAMLCSIGHAVMENRSEPAVQGDLTRADGRAERKAALDMMHRHAPGSTRRLTLGADKAYDAAKDRGGLLASLPPPASRAEGAVFGDRRTDGLSTKGYAMSQKHRKRIEELFGWSKTVRGAAQTLYRGMERVRSRFIPTLSAANLARRRGRAIWKRWSSYYVRSRGEARMTNLKSSGQRIASRASGRQTAEIERAA